MRIAKRTREEACWWLSAIAGSDFDEETSDTDIAAALGISNDAFHLANRALWQAPVQYAHACQSGAGDEYRYIAADCEALVREGWEP